MPRFRRNPERSITAPASAGGGPSLGHESAALRLGYCRVAGVDEVGRGCLFGPVVAAAVVLDPARRIDGLQDSKAISAGAREELSAIIRERAAPPMSSTGVMMGSSASNLKILSMTNSNARPTNTASCAGAPSLATTTHSNSGQPITTDHLPYHLRSAAPSSPPTLTLRRPAAPAAPASSPSRTLREVEMEHILRTLEKHNGNKVAAAAELGIVLKTLYNKLNAWQEERSKSAG